MTETTPVMRIRDWERRFEVNRTRELKVISWRPEPVNSDLYVEIVSHPDGAAHYGVLTALRNIAAKGNPRGSLTREGGRAHDAPSLARLARIPEPLMCAAIKRLIEIGEVELPTSHHDAGISHPQNDEPQADAGIPQEVAQYRTDRQVLQVGITDTHGRARENTEMLAMWANAGFDSPESFEEWFDALYREHPRKGDLQQAKTALVEAAIAGALVRPAFEDGYQAHVRSNDWTRESGRFVPKLIRFVMDRGWLYPPVEHKGAEESW